MIESSRRGSSQSYRLADLENVLSERGWSQADLARRSGLSSPTVRKAATGREGVSEHSANKIASALRVQVRSLCHDRSADSNQGSSSLANGASGHLDFDPGRMRQAMAERGMTPTEMASRTKLSVATVSSALRGQRQPQKNTIEKIAAVFEKAPEELCSNALSSTNSLVQKPEHRPAKELRMVAGQGRTTLYPREAEGIHETAKTPTTASAKQFSEAAETEDVTPVDTFWGMLSHLQQARKMVSSLMEYIGKLEEQVGHALTAEEDQGHRGANAGSESR